MKFLHFGTTARIATASLAVAVTGCVVLTKSTQPALSVAKPATIAQPTATSTSTLDRIPTRLSPRERLKRVAELSEESVEDLSHRFQAASSMEERGMLADALAMKGSGEAVLELLTQVLSEPDMNNRRALAEALKNLADKDGLETLLSANAATKDPTVLQQVIEAAGRMATPESVEFLVSLYRGQAVFPGQLRAVRQTLSQISSPEATRMLGTVATTATEPGLIEAAAHGLSKIDNPAALQRLVDTIAHVGTKDASLRASLLQLLGRINNPSTQAYRDQLLTEPLPLDVIQALRPQQRRTT